MVTINIKKIPQYARSMWNMVSFAQSRARKACLLALEAGPKNPSAIASSAGMNLSHVSRALRELSEKNLVECLTPKLTKNKIYKITSTGLEVVEKLKMLNADGN
jgi:predicted transcriptional regulator